MAEPRSIHWTEYACEAAGPAIFLVSASVFAVLIEHPQAALHQAVAPPVLRRALMGLAMALTALALIYGPIGRRSGAHFNPATTLAFWRLGRVAPADAIGYMVAQFAGAVAGITVAAALLGQPLMRVAFVATRPGGAGAAAAFAAELVMAALLMSVVLLVGNRPRINRLAGVCAAALVAIFITFESPISGMSLNPARSLAPEVHAGLWRFLWIYFLAPPLGMLAAAEVYRRTATAHPVLCAKLVHARGVPCPFHCRYPRVPAEAPGMPLRPDASTRHPHLQSPCPRTTSSSSEPAPAAARC